MPDGVDKRVERSLNMVTTLCSFQVCSRKRDEATLSKTDLCTVFSHSANGGAEKGSQANTLGTKSNLVTLWFNDNFHLAAIKMLRSYMGFSANGLVPPSI